MPVQYTALRHPVSAVVGVPIVIAVVILLVAVLPVTVPLHLILRRTGRLGFFVKKDGRWRYAVEPESFRAVPPAS